MIEGIICILLIILKLTGIITISWWKLIILYVVIKYAIMGIMVLFIEASQEKDRNYW